MGPENATLADKVKVKEVQERLQSSVRLDWRQDSGLKWFEGECDHTKEYREGILRLGGDLLWISRNSPKQSGKSHPRDFGQTPCLVKVFQKYTT